MTIENNDVISDDIKELLIDPDVKQRAILSRGLWYDTPLKVLEILSKDESDYVRSALTENDDIPQNILELLSKDNSIEVRKSVANCKKISNSIIENFLSDESEQVRECLAQNNIINEETMHI